MAVPLRNQYRDAPTPFVAEWTSVQELLRTRRAPWMRLLKEAIEPNAFYSPDYLAASVEMEQADIRCIAIYRDGCKDSDLIGLFPLARTRLSDGILSQSAEFYRNDYICLTEPLVSSHEPVGTWDAFLDRLAHTPGASRQIFGRLMASAGPNVSALREALARRTLGFVAFDGFERAAVVPTARFEDSFRRLGSSRRTNMGRRRRRLRECGTVTFTTHKGSDTPQAVEAFLRLEGSGWKGQSGSAMISTPGTAAFARKVFGSDQSEIDILSLNGQAIAAMASIVAGGVVYSVKTAYDESYGSYSPGLLLNIHLVRRVSGSTYKLVDSCADPDHTVDDYWLDRRQMEAIAFSAHADVSQARIEQTVKLSQSLRRIRNWVRDTMAGK